MNDDKLIAEYLQLFDLIYITDCYGVRDLLRLVKLEAEILKRGYEIGETPALPKIEKVGV